jgi:hypothetical protein
MSHPAAGATHIPLLVRTIVETTGPVIEFGAGYYRGSLRLSKGGVTYSVYLVETSDPNASRVRLQTTTGTKAIRIKT